MDSNIKSSRIFNRPKAGITAVIVVIAFAVGIFTLVHNVSESFGSEFKSTLTIEEPELVVTGTKVIGDETYTAENINKEKSYTRAQLKAIADDSSFVYSSINSAKTKLFYKASGITVSSLLSDTCFKADTDKLTIKARDEYKVSFDPSASYKQGATETVGLNQMRYVYPNFDKTSNQEAGKAEVPTTICWAYKSEKIVPSTAPECTNLKLMVGQYDINDQNNGLCNGGDGKSPVDRIIGGESISETALTIGSKKYSRAQVLLMKRADKLYQYTTPEGQQSEYVRGVPLSVLLSEYEDTDIVKFSTSNQGTVPASGMTVKEIKEKDYILAYEKGSNVKNLKGIFQKDGTDKGYFTLYGPEVKPAEMISKITVGADFSNSPYKHITNGGLSGQDGPYDIDGITGATLTIEGPGVDSAVPLSVRELENQDSGISRNTYFDYRGGSQLKTDRIYEGLDLNYLLTKMEKSGISLTESAKRVEIKNRSRQLIASLSLDQIKEMSQNHEPAMAAYGTSYKDGENIRPFVFDNGSGLDDTLGNGDGCLKFAYNLDSSALTRGQNPDYKTFGNMAYVYVSEEEDPGYKHSKAPYKDPKNQQYVLTVTGSEIGREVNYTVKDLENMVTYDEEGKPKANGMGWRGEYSMSNSTYWYVNEYEGVKLQNLLQKCGLEESKFQNDQVKVKFQATDGYDNFDHFSLKQIADPDQFGYYEKNISDQNDGVYQGVPGDLIKTGYPVLVAYGVNRYPYVINSSADGYLSGLKNDGGPLRIVSGKTTYSHANGSKQAKLLDKVIVGEDQYHYSTHKYHKNSVYKDLANTAKINVRVFNGEGENASEISATDYTAGQIEDLIYGSGADTEEAKIKAYYESGDGENDLYEGIDINYFLEEIVQLPGAKGTITFCGEKDETVSLSLEEVSAWKNGYNGITHVEALSPTLAYAKNGAPLVENNESDGYENTVTLGQGTEYENKVDVKNDGGPFKILFPRKSKSETEMPLSLSSVKSIKVNLNPDNYAHMRIPYDTYRDDTITIFGEGTNLKEDKKMKVSELEGRQALAETADYSIRSASGETIQQRYRGISLYKLLKSKSVGLKLNADKVRVTNGEGVTKEYTLTEVRKRDYINSLQENDQELTMLLAYGTAPSKDQNKESGRPLVKDKDSEGYDSEYGNDGGPIKVVTGQKHAEENNADRILDNVKRIEVTAAEMSSWNHNAAEIFKQYLKDKVTVQVVDQNNKQLSDDDYTVEELESMEAVIKREKITGTSEATWEGLDLWQFITQETNHISNVKNPVSITAFSKDGSSVDLLAKFGLNGLKNGIKDGDRQVPILLAYGMNEYPLVSGSKNTPKGEGYDAAVKNDGGPIRLMTHKAQGACLSEVNKIVIKINNPAPSGEKKVFHHIPADGTSGNLPVAGVRSVWMDQDHGLWVGTYGGGLAHKSKSASGFQVFNRSSNPALETTFVSAAAADREKGVWISQNASYTKPDENKGLAYMKGGQIKYYRASDTPETIPNDYVQEIQIDDQGTVWIGSFGGLTKYDPGKETWVTTDQQDGFPAMSVDNLTFDGKGGAWIGFYPDGKGTKEDPFVGGFAHVDQSGKINAYKQTAEYDAQAQSSKLAQVWVRDIAVDHAGGAWIVASGSLADMKSAGGTVWYVSKPGADPVKYTGKQLFGTALNGAKNAELRMVMADPDGGLWFGTSTNGVFYVKDPKINQKGGFDLTAEYSKETGSWETSNMNNVYSLDCIGRTVYVGSSGGLAYLDFPFENTNSDEVSEMKKILSEKMKAKVSAASYCSAKVSWNKINGSSGYEIWQKSGSKGTYKKVKTIKKDSTAAATIKGLKTGTTYYFKVIAYGDAGGNRLFGKYSAAKSVKPALKTPAVKVTPGSKAAKIKWGKISGASGYTIYRASSKTGTYKKIKTVKSGSKTGFTNKKLKKGKTYYYKVRAYRTISGKKVYSPYSKGIPVKVR